MHVRGVGPTGHRAIVGWLREQWLKPDRSIPTDAECEWAANAAINALTKRGVIELYDRDAAWVVTAQDERKQYSFGEAVADLADNMTLIATVEQAPNARSRARLIAAAPDLLAAVKFCANYSKNLQGRILDPQGERPGIAELSEIEEKARAAIAKAKGGAQ